MKIYTKTGDEGLTGLFNGERVRKDHLRIETYGTVDELNSLLGVVIAGCEFGELRELLVRVQHQLFDLGSDLATPWVEGGAKNEGKVRRIGAGEAAVLEGMIDEATGKVPPLRRFVLPGGTMTAARLHVARTVCRRAERLLVTFMTESEGCEAALIYLNRLSDLLFTWARWANVLGGIGDVEWDSEKAQ